MSISHYFIYFIIYSFFGWVYESLFYTFQFRKVVNTGFLKGCFCPIYGVACVFNLMAFRSVTNSTAIFLISAMVISGIEYMVSYILETIFEKRWWDYSDWPANLNGRISILTSIAFGLMSLAQIRIIHPVIEPMVEMMPERTEFAFVSISLILILTDLLFSLRSMDRADEKLWFIDEESKHMQQVNQRFSEHKKSISERYSDVREKIRNRINR